MYRKVLSVLLLITFLSNTCCFAITNKEINRTKKVRKQEAKDRYKKKKMPESGFMTVEEYERKFQEDGTFDRCDAAYFDWMKSQREKNR